jgi:rhodanese-related sulfurtransferase
MRFLNKYIKLLSIALIFFQSCDYLFPPFSGDKITVDQAYRYIKKNQGDEDLVVLDVRTKEEYDKAHLKNAVLLDYRQPSFPAEIEKLDKNKTYIIYSGNDGRSANTFQLMKELRFSDAHYIDGGIDQWQKQGLPLN